MWAPGPVPVAQDGFGLEGGVHPEVLGDAEQQPAGHPQVVGDVERREHPDLELPLAHHDLGVGALDADAGIDAGRRVELDDLPPRHLVAAHAAVVRALWGGVADGRPSERPTVLEEGVLLLDPEHRLLVAVLLHHGPQLGPGVGGVGSEVGQLDLAHDQLVVRGRAAGRGPRTPAGGRSRSRGPGPGWCSNRRNPRCPGSSPSATTLVLLRRRGKARSRRSRCTQLDTAHVLLHHFSFAAAATALYYCPTVPCRPMLPRRPPGPASRPAWTPHDPTPCTPAGSRHVRRTDRLGATTGWPSKDQTTIAAGHFCPVTLL